MFSTCLVRQVDARLAVPDNRFGSVPKLNLFVVVRQNFINSVACLTPLAAETVAAPRAGECPVQVQALVEHW